jgi:hypothetical protein
MNEHIRKLNVSKEKMKYFTLKFIHQLSYIEEELEKYLTEEEFQDLSDSTQTVAEYIRLREKRHNEAIDIKISNINERQTN